MASRYTFDFDKLPNVQSPYISIQLANDSLSWTGGRPDFFTSLKHSRKVQQANTMTISLAYAPVPGEDINRIEKAIVASRGYCYVQYGHILKNGTRDVTDIFKCLIYDYTVTFNQGSLQYSLSLISQSVVYNKLNKVSFSVKKDTDTVLDKAKYIVDTYMGDRYIFDEEGSSDAADAKFVKDFTVAGDSPVHALSNLAAQAGYFNSVTVDKMTATNDGYYDLGTEVIQEQDTNVLYVVEIDDAHTGKGYVRIKKLKKNEPEVTYSFDWNEKDSVVLDWKIEFKGTYTISASQAEGSEFSKSVATASTIVDEKTKVAKTTIKVSDSFIAGASSTLATDPIAEANMSIYADDWWSEKTSYAYGATLTVIGNPKLLGIGTSVIEVNPYVANQKHHSAGLYMVTGIDDSVDSGGYKTTYTLVRCAGDLSVYAPNAEGTYVYSGGAVIPVTQYDPYNHQVDPAG